jgi:hypothetical protein
MQGTTEDSQKLLNVLKARLGTTRSELTKNVCGLQQP